MRVKAKIPNYSTIKKRKIIFRLRSILKNPLSLVLHALVILSAIIAAGTVLFIIAYILIMGLPNLSSEMFSWKFTTENCSMLPALLNTLIMIAATLIIAVPIGIFSAIYLVEYAKKGNRLVSLIRLTTETLSGIPSIVYGLFGNILFLGVFKWGYSLIAGILTLAIFHSSFVQQRRRCCPSRFFTERAALALERENCVRYFVLCFQAPLQEYLPESFSQSDELWEKAPRLFIPLEAGPGLLPVPLIQQARFPYLCTC